MTYYVKAIDTAKPEDTDRTAYARVHEDEGDPTSWLRMPEGDEYTGVPANILLGTIAKDPSAKVEEIDEDDVPYEMPDGGE